MAKKRMHVTTIDDLRRNSIVDAATHCWHWQGSMNNSGCPRIYTLDFERCEKRPISGPKAVWNIAHQCAPLQGFLVFRTCFVDDCVNPAHHKQARDKTEIGLHIRARGVRKGTAVEQRVANIKKAWEKNGIKPTAPELVAKVRAMTGTVTSIAHKLGMTRQTVSRIRLGQSHKHLLELEAA